MGSLAVVLIGAILLSAFAHSGMGGSCPTTVLVDSGDDVVIECSFPDGITSIAWYDSTKSPSNPGLLVARNSSSTVYHSEQYDVIGSGSLRIKGLSGGGEHNISLTVVYHGRQLNRTTEYVDVIVKADEPLDFWLLWVFVILIALLVTIMVLICIGLLICRKCCPKNEPKELKDEEKTETLPELKQLMHHTSPERIPYTDQPETEATPGDRENLSRDGEPVSSPTYSISEGVFHLKPASPLRTITMVLEDDKLEVVD